MVEKLGFKTVEEAAALRSRYFVRYHSTLKALAVAAEDAVAHAQDAARWRAAG